MGWLIALCAIEAVGCIGAAVFYNKYCEEKANNKELLRKLREVQDQNNKYRFGK